MEDTKKNLSPIAPMTDVDLEQVSGGNVLLDYQYGANIMASLSNNVSALLAPFADDLNSLEGQLRYRDVLNDLSTYDTSKRPMSEKCAFLAASWNDSNPNQHMTPQLAQIILSIKNPNDRAAIVCLKSTDDIMSVLQKMFEG